MSKFIKRPVTVDAITFDELMQHGIDQCRNEGRESSIINGMPWSFSYNGHHISHENDQCYIIPTLEGSMNMTPDAMLITGVQGEIYPCRLDIFESTYVANDSDTCSHVTFGDAIQSLKQGKCVARSGWNGKGMWLAYVSMDDWQVADSQDSMPCNFEGRMLPWIGMHTAQGDFVPWLASQTDVLADDWQVIEHGEK